LLYIGLHRLRC